MVVDPGLVEDIISQRGRDEALNMNLQQGWVQIKIAPPSCSLTAEGTCCMVGVWRGFGGQTHPHRSRGDCSRIGPQQSGEVCWEAGHSARNYRES